MFRYCFRSAQRSISSGWTVSSRRLFSTVTSSGLELSFSLDDCFLDKYKNKVPPFGYNGLGELVYKRTYARKLPDGTNEDWWQTVRRVVEGTYSIQKDYLNQHILGWDEKRGQCSAQEMYDLMFNMKFLPPGCVLFSSLMCRSWIVGDGNRCCSQEKSFCCLE